jgi:polyphenol oxidase
MRHPDWLAPEWQLPGIGALMTTRAGGVGAAPFDSLNLRAAVGDDPVAVAHNHRVVAEAIGAAPVWLNQVHGRGVVRLTAADARADASVHRADASITTEPGVVCAVQVADCLPVLFAAPGRRAVGAAHAGWRGLALGVLEATLQAVCEVAACEPREVRAWLGACIGPAQFEVGADVLEAFDAAPDSPRFKPRGPAHPGKWLGDLPSLARDRLHAAGVVDVSGGGWCTVSEPSRFFSFRRDGITGRMAACIWTLPR